MPNESGAERIAEKAVTPALTQGRGASQPAVARVPAAARPRGEAGWTQAPRLTRPQPHKEAGVFPHAAAFFRLV